MKRVRSLLLGAIMISAALVVAAPAAAANPPNWVAALYVEAQKMVGLRWTPVPGATGYKVLRGTTAGSGYQEIAAPATPQHFDRDLEPGTTYYYVLQAVDAAGPSANSEERSVAIPGAKKVEAVKSPEWDKVVPQSSTEFGKVTAKVGLFWKASKGNIAAYNVYRSTSPGSGYQLVGSTPETQFVDAAVEAGKTYYYVLSALDAATFMETPYSPEQAVEIKAPEKREKKKEERIVQKFRVAKSLATIQSGEWGRLANPIAVDVDWAGGVIFVANKGDKMIYRFSLSGEFLSKFNGESAEEPKGIREPAGIDWEPYEELLYVADNGGGKVFVFDGEGNPKRTIPVLKEHGTTVDPKAPVVVSDVCASADGEQLAVVDNGRHKILLYESGGAFQEELSVGMKGTELGSFTYPTRCVWNPNKGFEGDLLVTDTFGVRVQVRSGETGQWRAFGSLGEVAGSFKTVIGIAVDRNNHVWTADKDNFVVTEFDYEGNYLNIIGQKEINKSGNNVFLMGTPLSVVVHPEKDEVVVGDYWGATVHRLALTDEIITGK